MSLFYAELVKSWDIYMKSVLFRGSSLLNNLWTQISFSWHTCSAAVTVRTPLLWISSFVGCFRVHQMHQRLCPQSTLNRQLLSWILKKRYNIAAGALIECFFHRKIRVPWSSHTCCSELCFVFEYQLKRGVGGSWLQFCHSWKLGMCSIYTCIPSSKQRATWRFTEWVSCQFGYCTFSHVCVVDWLWICLAFGFNLDWYVQRDLFGLVCSKDCDIWIGLFKEFGESELVYGHFY
jgi:hypothetical protein